MAPSLHSLNVLQMVFHKNLIIIIIRTDKERVGLRIVFDCSQDCFPWEERRWEILHLSLVFGAPFKIRDSWKALNLITFTDNTGGFFYLQEM